MPMYITDQEAVALIRMSTRENPVLLPYGAQRLRLIDSPTNVWAVKAVVKMREESDPAYMREVLGQ